MSVLTAVLQYLHFIVHMVLSFNSLLCNALCHRCWCDGLVHNVVGCGADLDHQSVVNISNKVLSLHY